MKPETSGSAPELRRSGRVCQGRRLLEPRLDARRSPAKARRLFRHHLCQPERSIALQGAPGPATEVSVGEQGDARGLAHDDDPVMVEDVQLGRSAGPLGAVFFVADEAGLGGESLDLHPQVGKAGIADLVHRSILGRDWWSGRSSAPACVLSYRGGGALVKGVGSPARIRTGAAGFRGRRSAAELQGQAHVGYALPWRGPATDSNRALGLSASTSGPQRWGPSDARASVFVQGRA